MRPAPLPARASARSTPASPPTLATGRRSIKAKQAEFQRLKKLSGNTHTAKNYLQNRGLAVFVICGGIFMAANGLRNLALGINKHKLEDD